MKVPEGVRVSPATEHLLGHLPSRQEVQEHCMQCADGLSNTTKRLGELAAALRSYAADNTCANALALMSMTSHLSDVMNVLIPMVVEMALMHEIHEHHGPEPVGVRLDRLVPVTTQEIVELRARVTEVLASRTSEDPIGMLLAILADQARRENT